MHYIRTSMASKIILPERRKQLKTFSYRMDNFENTKADKLCRLKYSVSLSTLIRTLILTEFPEAKTKPKV